VTGPGPQTTLTPLDSSATLRIDFARAPMRAPTAASKFRNKVESQQLVYEGVS